jgi:DNA polymerase elongation subunit (family B)
MANIILEFYPYDFDYDIKNDKAVIKILGLTPEGKKVIVFDNLFKPYFYVLVKKNCLKKVAEELAKIKLEFEGREVMPLEILPTSKNLENEKVSALRVDVQQPADISLLKDRIRLIDGYIDCIESDIPFVKRYLIDKKLTPLAKWRVAGKSLDRGTSNAEYIIDAEGMTEVELETAGNPKIIVFDIETYNPIGSPRPEVDPIVMISIASNTGLKKLLCWKRFENAPDYVEFLDSEMDIIARFVEIIKEESPMIISGYNSDNFDLPYIKTRASKYKIKMDIGFDGAPLKINRRGLGVAAKINGVIHLDAYIFIKNILAANLKTEAYDLNSVAEELVGEKKVDGIKIDDFYKVWDAGGDLKTFAKYCMHDSVITLKLVEKIIPMIFELTKLIGQPLFDICRMTYGQCVEWYLSKNANDYGEFIPNKPLGADFGERLSKTYVGAYVQEPKPGIYEGVVVFDFRSLYPSIIVSYNIGGSTIKCKCCERGAKEKIWFCKKKKGFIPGVLEDLINRRDRIKEIMKTVKKDDKDYVILSSRSYALKTVANAMYGYLGFARSRWYCLECAARITELGREYIKKVINQATKAGFNVLYADTDSLFISLENKSLGAAEKFIAGINKSLPGVMELEFQGFYPRGIFVSKKVDVEKGAKKKYVLVDESGGIVIKGFEYVRRDWSEIAKRAQMAVIHAVLKDNSKEKAFEIIKATIKKLRMQEVPFEDVAIYTQLSRRLDAYESIGPHVAAALKAQKKGQKFEPGQIIRYIVTKGEGSISDRSYIVNDFIKAKLEYDPEYYINNQVIPAVEKIFEVLGYSKEELVGKIQKTLGEF